LHELAHRVQVVADHLGHALDEPAGSIELTLKDMRDFVIDQPVHLERRNLEDHPLVLALPLLDLVVPLLKLHQLLEVEADLPLVAGGGGASDLLGVELEVDAQLEIVRKAAEPVGDVGEGADPVLLLEHIDDHPAGDVVGKIRRLDLHPLEVAFRPLVREDRERQDQQRESHAAIISRMHRLRVPRNFRVILLDKIWGRVEDTEAGVTACALDRWKRGAPGERKGTWWAPRASNPWYRSQAGRWVRFPCAPAILLRGRREDALRSESKRDCDATRHEG